MDAEWPRDHPLTDSHTTNPIVRWMHFLAASNRSSSVQNQRVRHLTGYPITMADIRALKLLDVADPMTISEAAQELDVNLSRASRQVSSLEALGLVARLPGVTDGRSSRVSSSELGRRVLRDWEALFLTDYVSTLADWDVEEIQRFGDRLQTLIAGLSGPGRRRTLQHFDPGASATDPTKQAALAHTLPTLMDFVTWANDRATGTASLRRVLEAARCPVPYQPLTTLRVILRRGPLDITELARRLGLDTSRTSRHVALLEEHGLILRAGDVLDGRRKRIKATKEGAALIRRVDSAELAPFTEVLETWEDSKVTDLLGLLDRFIDGMLSRPAEVGDSSRA